jgi:hypothetical protein
MAVIFARLLDQWHLASTPLDFHCLKEKTMALPLSAPVWAQAISVTVATQMTQRCPPLVAAAKLRFSCGLPNIDF